MILPGTLLFIDGDDVTLWHETSDPPPAGTSRSLEKAGDLRKGAPLIVLDTRTMGSGELELFVCSVNDATPLCGWLEEQDIPGQFYRRL